MQVSSPLTYSRAKRFRKEMTPAERTLWFKLRGGRLNGFKFYRQVPIGPFVADFVHHGLKLIVEVDGATHSTADELAHDASRTRYLTQQGYRILRIWNHDVFKNLGDVMDHILFVLEEQATQQKL